MESLAGLSEEDAAAIAEASGVTLPTHQAPSMQQQHTWQHPQGQGGHGVHSVDEDADLALAMQLQEEEREHAAREEARAQQAQQAQLVRGVAGHVHSL